MDIILRPWRLYANFDGRSRRSEYWVFILVRYGVLVTLFMLVGGIAGVLDATQGRAEGSEVLAAVVALALIVWLLGTMVPGWAVTVRRLHDAGMPFGWLFLTFVPYIGALAALIFGILPGNEYENDYGLDPRRPAGAGPDELGGVFS